MNEVCSKDSINWFKYDNFITTNNTYICEERTILRKWIKIKVEKEIERRGDSIGKITFGITREETKKFCIWNYISNFFLKIII